MFKLTIGLFLISTLFQVTNTIESTNNINAHSRTKRFLVFPEGSTFSVAICMTAQTTLPTEIFTEAINWGISYELPNDSSKFTEYLQPKHVVQRRHRRDLYQKMEVIMNSMGYDGRACILRALCETNRELKLPGNGIVESLLQLVFRFPQERLMHFEPDEHRLYHWAHRFGLEESNKKCSDVFPGCSVSLIQMALGGFLQDTFGYS